MRICAYCLSIPHILLYCTYILNYSTFLDHLKSGKTASPDETPELFYREGEEPPAGQDEEQEWMKDMPAPLLEALMAGDRAYTGAEPGAADNGVADLLVSQTETSDLVLLNKVDLVEDPDVLTRIEEIVNALNPRVTTMRSTFGKIPLRSVLGVAGGTGAVEAGVVDDHRDAVQAAVSEHRHEEHSSHSHNDNCEDDACTDPSHDHSHDSASHSHAQEQPCEDTACTDPSHDHSHDSASHSHAQEEQCEDAACTDPSHDHSHGSHDHAHAHGGIGTFVYRARRPFHPGRLVSFLRYLPVTRGLPPVGEDEAQLSISKSTHETMKLVLRSKGFTWCADSNVAAMFLSHAGSSVELSCLGRWWSTLSRQQWPSEATSAILEDFDVASHDEEDPASTTVGDRRQELVFIGQSLGNSDNQKAIGEALDQCLLDDGEWSIFQDKKSDENALRAIFASASAMQPKVMSY
jgi:G3E family GTPase